VVLDDLLVELRENLLHDRSDQVAGTSDRLWSDVTLVRYIDEAQRRFARRSLCIRDATIPKFTQITTVANQNYYTLDPAVVAVISARFAGDIADLKRAGHSQFDTYSTPDSYFFDPSYLSTVPPAKPLAWATDEETAADPHGSVGVVKIRLFPTPDAVHAGVIVNMRVCRLPQTRLTTGELTVYPEIPEDYHIPMLDYAAYLALRIVDHEMGDAARAAEFLKSFEAHVDEARQELLRKMFTPHAWGFGRGGWQWEGN
jgi:hypothetical protein